MLPLESQQDEYVEVPIIQPIPQEDRHEGDYAHFLATRYYIQAQIMLVVELARIATVFDNPRNYALTLCVSIEPSKITCFKYVEKHLICILLDYICLERERKKKKTKVSLLVVPGVHCKLSKDHS